MQEILNFLKELSLEMGEIALKYFKKLEPNQIHNKTKGIDDPVTIADLEISKHIQKRIKEHFNGKVNVMSEESINDFQMDNRPMIIVDELDGTKVFRDGKENFCHLLCYYDKEPLVAVIYDPLKKEIFSAIKGEGTYLNKNRLECSKETEFNENSKIVLYFGAPKKHKEKYKEFFNIENKLKEKIRYNFYKTKGSVGITSANIVKQIEEGSFISAPKNWDCAATYLIIKEAGGNFYIMNDKNSFTNPKEWTLQAPKNMYPVLITNGHIDKSLLEYVKRFIKG